MSGTLAQYESIASQDAAQFGVPQSLFLDQIQQESGFNPNAINGDATGIAQFEPGTASEFGINPLDPSQSLSAASEYDSELYNQSGSWLAALQNYGTVPKSGALDSGQAELVNLAAPAGTASYLTALEDFPGLSSISGTNSPGGSNVFAQVLGGIAGTELGGNLGTGIGSELGGLLGSNDNSSSSGGLGKFIGEIAARGALVLLGIVMILGGFFILGQRSGVDFVKKNPAALAETLA